MQIFHILHFPLWTDDAFFGLVAKNLAGGAGYAASVTKIIRFSTALLPAQF